MNICDKCKNYYRSNHYCQYWDCDVTRQHETCCGFENMTNSHRIRAMSDEELAVWICDLYNADTCCQCPGANYCHHGDGKANGLKTWLQQPAESPKEGHHAE